MPWGVTHASLSLEIQGATKLQLRLSHSPELSFEGGGKGAPVAFHKHPTALYHISTVKQRVCEREP